MSSFFQTSSSTPSSSGATPARELPWVEKYRPKRVDDVAHQDEAVRTLKASIATGNLPHLLFYGPAGTGKTSTILAVARELYGPEFRQNGRVLELNASDERGISIVRNKIKTFAQGAVAKGTKHSSMPPFKLIILDEADSMTADAQSALRRMIENYSKVTRFCLVCNYVSRIIEPVASRCAKFRFKPLQAAAMSDRLTHICNAEGVKATDGLVQTVLEQSEGDMRKAINILQSAHRLNGTSITSEHVLEIVGVAPETMLVKLWQAISSYTFNSVRAEVDELAASGFQGLTILQQLSKDIIAHEELSDAKKAKLSLVLAQADKNLVDGASEYLQLLDVASKLMTTWHAN